MNEALRLLRVYHDMKASELAADLQISTSYLSEIENGKKQPTLDLLRRYARAFRTTLPSLLVIADTVEKKGTKLRRYVGKQVVELLGKIEKSNTEDV